METVKGFKDFSGEDAIKRQKIKEILTRNFSLYGFEPAETPIIEFENFVVGDNSQDEAVSDTFKLKDRGDRKLALRYEFTFQLKRLAKNKKLPYKRYQIGEVFRDEPVSSNRFRQFTQCDVDVIGSNIKYEAEVLALTYNVLKEIGINAEIFINSRRLLNEILDSEGVKNKEEVLREIDKLDKLSDVEVRRNLKKYKAEKLLLLFKKNESYFKKYEYYNDVKELKKFCDFYGVKVRFLSYLVRGLSYYNGNVFEVKLKDSKDSIVGGGSYLVNGIQSTGLAFGLERLCKLVKFNYFKKNILIISLVDKREVFKIADNFRKEGISCSIIFGKPSSSLDYANSKNIPYVIFIGEKELKLNKFKLKDMNSGKEELLNLNNLIKKIKKDKKEL